MSIHTLLLPLGIIQWRAGRISRGRSLLMGISGHQYLSRGPTQSELGASIFQPSNHNFLRHSFQLPNSNCSWVDKHPLNIAFQHLIARTTKSVGVFFEKYCHPPKVTSPKPEPARNQICFSHEFLISFHSQIRRNSSAARFRDPI